MLVILSDLHLTDETTSRNVPSEAFADLLLDEISDNAEDNKAEEVHIVLLGDIFDLVRTDFWQKVNEDERPWGGQLDPMTGMNRNSAVLEESYDHVLKAILDTQTGQSFIDMFKTIAADSPAPTKISYVVGNHDRAFWNFPSLQQEVQNKLGSRIAVNFCHSLCEPKYGVLARHGHEWDENNHGWLLHNKVLNKDNPLDRFDPSVCKVMAIGEVITAELMGGFIHRVKPKLDEGTVDQLKDLNNVRPMTDVFRWLEWFTGERLSREDRTVIVDALAKSLDCVLDTPFAKMWDKTKADWLVTGDLTDRLAKLNFLVPQLGYSRLKASVDLFDMLGKVFGGGDEYIKGSQSEWKQEDPGRLRDIQYVVYGHTHRALHECFEGTPDGEVKMYVNTGTYLPLIERASDDNGFYMAHRMTMAFFYSGDEDRDGRTHDRKPTVDLWTGIKRKQYR
jgi:UDP-2,3-diacylglucosamine pyrophosphatase LpxH